MLRVLAKYCTRMSDQYTLEAFTKRSLLAEEKLTVLRQHLAKLKEHTFSSFASQEEEKLRLENEQLRNQLGKLKEELLTLEKLNGVKQVALPEVSVTSEKVESTPNKETTSQKESVKTTQKTNNRPAKQKKDGKPKKTPKAAPEERPVDVSRLDMRVAKIMSVKRHPDADTLYLEEIDAGEESLRTVVTGVANHIPIDQMQDRMVVLMCNLKPAKMRGILSQAMVMCANTTEKVEILDPPSSAVPGDRIVFEGYTGQPDAILNPKKKIFEKVQPDLHTDKDCIACYKGVPFTVEGKGVCKAQTMINSSIK